MFLYFSVFAPWSLEGRNRWITSERQSLVAQLQGAKRQGSLLCEDAGQYTILIGD